MSGVILYPQTSFYHMFNSQKRKKNTVLSNFITDFTAEGALPMTS